MSVEDGSPDSVMDDDSVPDRDCVVVGEPLAVSARERECDREGELLQEVVGLLEGLYAEDREALGLPVSEAEAVPAALAVVEGVQERVSDLESLSLGLPLCVAERDDVLVHDGEEVAVMVDVVVGMRERERVDVTVLERVVVGDRARDTVPDNVGVAVDRVGDIDWLRDKDFELLAEQVRLWSSVVVAERLVVSVKDTVPLVKVDRVRVPVCVHEVVRVGTMDMVGVAVCDLVESVIDRLRCVGVPVLDRVWVRDLSSEQLWVSVLVLETRRLWVAV